MLTKRLGVTPSTQELIQEFEAAQVPMALHEYARRIMPPNIDIISDEERAQLAREIVSKYKSAKPRKGISQTGGLSPDEHFVLEQINELVEAGKPSWRKPAVSRPRGVESWGSSSEQRTPLFEQSDNPQLKFDFGETTLLSKSKDRTENPEAGTGKSIVLPEIPSRQPRSDLDEYALKQLRYVPQVSDPERRYIHLDDIARGRHLHEYLKDEVGDEGGISKLLPYSKTPYSIIDAAREAKTPEDLQKIQEAFDQHKEKRRQFIHTPTLEVPDPDPRVVAWHESKRLAELGVPIDAPFTVKNNEGISGKPEISVEPGHAEAARILMTNEFHAQKAIDEKQKEFLLRDPHVISLQEAKEREDRARVEEYTRASETHRDALESAMASRDAEAAQARDLHATQLKAEELKTKASRIKALDANINARDSRMGAMLTQAGLSPNLLEEIEKYPEVATEDNSQLRNLFKEEYGGKTPTLHSDDFTQAGELRQLAPKLLPPVLPKKLPKVPSSDAPIYKEHLRMTPVMTSAAGHINALKPEPEKAEPVLNALGELKKFRDEHLTPAPPPVHTPPPSWGERFWKGVEGIGDMIPGIHEGSNKYLRRAAGIALPLGVAGGTALLANHYLNKRKEEPTNEEEEEHQPKKMASLAMFQNASVR